MPRKQPMKRDRGKSSDVKPVIKQEAKPSNEDQSTKETIKNSTTSDTIRLEAWIVSGLLLSVVQQIVAVSLLIKDTND